LRGPDGLETGHFRAHNPGMQRRAWKIVIHIPGLDNKLGWTEYFLVRDSDRMSALAALWRARPDLASHSYEFKGEASQDFLDWIHPDKDVFSIMVLS
jgi:hypothetical protein